MLRWTRILPHMRPIPFRESAAALPPFGRPVAGLIESSPDPRIHKIVEFDQVPRVVTQFILNTKPAPLRRLRPASSGRWRIRRLWPRLLGQRAPDKVKAASNALPRISLVMHSPAGLVSR